MLQLANETIRTPGRTSRVRDFSVPTSDGSLRRDKGYRDLTISVPTPRLVYTSNNNE